ncbi:MAG TPA: hypothetical protein VKM54_15090 [Myxococcota bacterium]|nr:hypothetical protein [Myxococcota bacterium]
MRARHPVVVAALVALCLVRSAARADTPSKADDGGSVGIVVLNEHAIGSASLVQPYLDRIVAIAAARNDWTAARGQYCTSREAAEAYIRSQAPHYGILSLAAFLSMRKSYQLEVIGSAAVSLVGGQQYHIITQTAVDLDGCRGKRLATNHADDRKFLERVVARSSFKLAEFTLVETPRPLLTIKKLLAGEAECALIDDAQLAELSHIPGTDGVRSIWDSPKLPPLVVVAFPAAPRTERKEFQKNLPFLCEGEGQGICAEVGIVSIQAADSSTYAAVVAAYGS